MLTEQKSAEQRRLEECSQEPIRTPGAIQPHGALLAIDRLTRVVEHASDNCGLIIGTDAEAILGSPLDTVVGEEWAAANAEVLAGTVQAKNPLAITLAGQRFDVIIHQVAGLAVLEFEPSLIADDYQSAPAIYESIHALTSATTVSELWASAAREMRQLTLFDRVMVYHFHPDGHGEVVAEELAEGMEPYLGLHFPASDIPTQARELYLTKLSRMIASSAGETSALLSQPAVGGESVPATTIDLSRAELRSVSPFHLQFMRNMGQASTLSMSLARDGQLIGMITLANRTPRRVPYVLRQGLEVLATQVALQLSSMTEIRRLNRQMHVRSIRSQLVNGLVLLRATDAEALSSALFEGSPTVLDLIPAQGAMLSLGDHTSTIGVTPDVDDVVAAAKCAELGDKRVLVTDSLGTDIPEAAALLPGVTGLLIVPIADGKGFIAWFRPEITETVDWLGDQTPGNRATPLSPRTSFSSWTQSVFGRSAPWSGLESEALELANDLAGVAVRHEESQLATLALHDTLTGLPNRRMVMEKIDVALANYAAGAHLSVLFVDLDGFKQVNDTHGHDVGDAVLVHVAKQILATTRTHDTVARLGGDEFVVLCQATTPEEAAVVARRIVDAVRQPTFVAGITLAITASVGMSAADSSSTPATLLRAADGAMYRAKSGGRDQLSL